MSEESLGRLRNAARLLEAEVGKRVELSKLRFLMKFVSDTSNALKDSEDEGALKEHRTGLQTVVQMLQTVCQIRQRKAGILLISMSFGEFLQEKEMQQTVGDGRIAPCSLADSNLSIPTYNENSSEDEEEEQSTGRSHIKSCKSVKDAANEFDNFAESRRIAIESTIVTKLDELPSFSDIVGLDEAKNTLLEALVDPLLYPEWFKNSDLRPWKAVLLFGPPGTGKSALSQAIVKQIHSVLYQVSSSDLISSWSGQSEKLIRELFDHAIAQGKTTVIFIDEVDSICRVRHSSEEDANRRVKTELLVQIQRLQRTDKIVLVCATNCPWELDPAFLRRFEKKIFIGLPDATARAALLKKRLVNTQLTPEVTFDWLALQTAGMSGDDLRRFASELGYLQFRYFKVQDILSIDER
ncbi:hypothetical protein WR25_12658 isoform C [Diploscapter pachys]|uniref:AAA+ ATPase domain-containing protein n=1 Tax=Diploscapter pachys TaxID=2018661 RepID=A0A2A2LXM8_9BILA|nr:hypothetical protein WR25_12658 isoform C [Diploscapter pachys]